MSSPNGTTAPLQMSRSDPVLAGYRSLLPLPQGLSVGGIAYSEHSCHRGGHQCHHSVRIGAGMAITNKPIQRQGRPTLYGTPTLAWHSCQLNYLACPSSPTAQRKSDSSTRGVDLEFASERTTSASQRALYLLALSLSPGIGVTSSRSRTSPYRIGPSSLHPSWGGTHRARPLFESNSSFVHSTRPFISKATGGRSSMPAAHGPTN